MPARSFAPCAPAALVLGLLASCGSGAAPAAEAPAVAGYPRTVATPQGDELVLPAPPQRVFPANASALDYLADLVAPERIAAIPDAAATWTNASFEGEEWAAIPRVARYEGEVVLSVAPNLVVTHEWQDPDTARVLRNAAIPVAKLPDFEDFDSIRRSIAFLGEVLEVRDRADGLLASLDRRIAALKASPERAAVRAASYTNYGTGGWIAGANTSADLLIRLCGMRNAAAEAGFVEHPRLDIEGLLDLDPDVLIVGGPEEGVGESPTRTYVMGEAALAALRVCREDRIVVLPAALFGTNSHRLVDAAERLAIEVDALLARDAE